MKIITNTTIYKCDFCKKKYEKQHACIRHEKYCGSNPDNHSICSGCQHLEEKKEDIDCGDSWHRGITVKYYFCKKHLQRLHPLKAERTGIVGKYPEQFEDSILFPKECEDYKYFND